MVMLCAAVAQGLMEPWCVAPVRVDQEPQDTEKADVQPTAEKTKKVRGKSVEKSGPTHGPALDAAAVQDLKKALEVSNCSSPKHKAAFHKNTLETAPVQSIVGNLRP